MCLKTIKFKNSKKAIDKFDNFTRPKNRNKKRTDLKKTLIILLKEDKKFSMELIAKYFQ